MNAAANFSGGVAHCEELMRKTRKLLLISFFLFIFSTTALAHPGRTDGSGGHKDNKNKSGLGSYHYHCGGYPAHLHRNGYCPYRDVFPKKVKVHTEKTVLGIGEKISVTATVTPTNACDTYVYWESSDTNVIRVSGGMLEAVGYGTATITATSFNDKVGSVKITVKEIKAEKVKVTTPIDGENVYIGDSFELKAEIVPENVDDPTICWTSSDKDVAFVSSNGYVKTRSPGTVTITAMAINGIEGTFSFTVQEKCVESVEIQYDDHVQLLLCEEVGLNALVLPQDASYPELTWESSNEEVVAVSANGRVSAVGCGTAIITATTGNGMADSISVEVTEIIAEKIEIEGDSKILIGEETTLRPVFYPADTTIQTIEWAVSDESIAQIDAQGRIHAINVGTVIVTAQGKDVQTEISFEVLPRLVEDIMINSSVGEKMHPGEVAIFTASVLPNDATYQELTWTSSNPQIAEIDDSGNLKAKGIGRITITATAGDGYTETFELRVVLSIQSVLSILCGCVVIAGGGIVLARRKR